MKLPARTGDVRISTCVGFLCMRYPHQLASETVKFTAHMDIEQFAGRLFHAYRGARKRMRPVACAPCLIVGDQFAPSTATYARAQDTAASTSTQPVSPPVAGAIDTHSLLADPAPFGRRKRRSLRIDDTNTIKPQPWSPFLADTVDAAILGAAAAEASHSSTLLTPSQLPSSVSNSALHLALRGGVRPVLPVGTGLRAAESAVARRLGQRPS